MKSQILPLICKLIITSESSAHEQDGDCPWGKVSMAIQIGYLPPAGFIYHYALIDADLEVTGEYFASLSEPNLISVIVSPSGGISDTEVDILEANGWTVTRPQS